MKEAIIDGDEERAAEATREALDEGAEPQEAIKAASKVLGEVGDKYDSGEYFLFDLVASGDAMNEAREILEEAIFAEGGERESEGKVVIGTVEGDIHDIGKKILGSVLTARGFEVFDLGVEVPADEFVEKIEEIEPEAIGASALLTTTKEKQRELVEVLEEEGLRDDVLVMVGGAPCTEEWKDEIEADLYGENAFVAVSKLQETMGVGA
jgi:corrinoid protein of di/trimethylamine methyltransferase